MITNVIKKGCAAILAIMLLFAAFSTVTAEAVPTVVMEKEYSVFYVEVGSGDSAVSGTCFVIQNDASGTYLVTNNHVVEDATLDIKVYLTKDDSTSAKKIASDEQYDLAILKTNRALDADALCFEETAVRGEAVYAMGFPGASDILSDEHDVETVTVTDGIVSKLSTMRIVDYGPGVSMVQHTAPINHGNSGGPLLNSAGNVLGVNTYGVNVEVAQGVFGAVSSSAVLDFAMQNGLMPETSNQSVAAAETGSQKKLTQWMYAIGGVAVLFLVGIVLSLIFVKRLKPVACIAVTVICLGLAALSLQLIQTHYTKQIRLAGEEHRYTDIGAYTAQLVRPTEESDTYGQYAEAGLKMEARDYDGALPLFRKLGGFLDSSEKVSECLYQKAAILADQGDYEGAIRTYTSIAGYRDADEKVFETTCRQGAYYIEQGQYDLAMEIFLSLRETATGEQTEYINETFTPVLYSLGVDAYRAEDYETAKTYLTQIPSTYDRTQDYLDMIEVHESIGILEIQNGQEDFVVNTVLRLWDFEDAKALCYSRSCIMKAYLEGVWKDTSNRTVLSYESGRATIDCFPSILTQIPFTIKKDYGNGSYYGLLLIEKKAGYESYFEGPGSLFISGDKEVFSIIFGKYEWPTKKFTILSIDEIEVYCYVDGNTYYLHRG